MKYSDSAVTEAINSPAKRARAQNGNSKSSLGIQSSPSKKPKVVIETKIRSNQQTNMKPSVVTPEKSRKITNPYKKGSKKGTELIIATYQLLIFSLTKIEFQQITTTS